jgi:hypothetical protein
MSAPLNELPGNELRLKIEGTRRRLEVWVGRLAVLRERLAVAAPGHAADHQAGPGGAQPSGPEGSGVGRAAAVPLFQRASGVGGALDDVDLHFEVLDTEDPGRQR